MKPISILSTSEIALHARRLERLRVKAKQLRKELKANALEQRAIKRTLKEQKTHDGVDEWTEAHAPPIVAGGAVVALLNENPFANVRPLLCLGDALVDVGVFYQANPQALTDMNNARCNHGHRPKGRGVTVCLDCHMPLDVR